jgi:thioesterase domain-containing protein
VIENNYLAIQAYKLKPYKGQITLLRARGGRLLCNHDPGMGWGEFAAGGVSVNMIPGSHLRIFQEPNIRDLAQQLQYCLDQAQEKARLC